MSQPPDDRRPMPWETPDPQAPADQPTVAWTPPAEGGEPPTTPEPGSTGFAGTSGPPVGWGSDATPGSPAPDSTPVAPGPAAPAEPVPPAATPPPVQSPLISAAPTPAVSWAAPQAAVREVAPGLVFASTASRFVAFLLDSIIIGVIAGIIASVTGLAGTPATLPDGQPDLSRLISTSGSTILTAVLGGFYFVLSWSGGRRATIGQRLLSIQVGNAFDGAALTFEQAIRRWLGLGLFLGIFVFAPGLAAISGLIQFVWIIALLVTTATSPTKQGLHDRFANTALVRPTTAGNGWVTACLVIVVLLFALFVVGIVALIYVGGQVSTILSTVGESV